MEKYRVFIGVICLQLLITVGLYFSSVLATRTRAAEINAKRLLVSSLRLTDLSLWTGAPYLRHPSLADRFSPFQDFPSSVEHFPAGSIIAPPVTPHGGEE